MNLPRDKARFKTTLADIFEAFKGRADPSGPPAFIGAAYRDPLEHTTRRYVIDDILAALGWDLSRLTQEMVEEARARGDTTLFLDYLGVNPAEGVPLLIVEAKAWAKPLVAASNSGAATQGKANSLGNESLIAAAIDHCKAGGEPKESPVILEWAEWLQKLHRYVKTIHARSGHVVQCVTITAGRWWVFFRNPREVFLSDQPVSTAEILILSDADVVARSDEIFDRIARQILIRDPPFPIQPAQLAAYADHVSTIRLYHALWVARRRDGASFAPFPQINLYPAVVVERSDGQLITVVDQLRPRHTFPHEYAELPDHVDEVAQSAQALLQAVNLEIGTTIAPSPVSGFPGFPLTSGVLSGASAGKYCKPSQAPDEFLLVTGDARHFLLAAPTIHPCAGHVWAECRDLRENQGATPIVERSFSPASFFTTLESHHCAHRTVHLRRASRCQVAAFEEFLCCRACVFQTVCWTPTESAQLPCGVVAENAAAPMAAS